MIKFMWIPALIVTYLIGDFLAGAMPADGVERAVIPWWTLASIAVPAAVNLFTANKAAKAQSGAASDALDIHRENRDRADAAISDMRRDFKNVSPEQTAFMDRLRKQMKDGTIPVGQVLSQVAQRTNEQGNVATQRVRGEAASAGFGSSAATATAVGRQQSKIVQAIAEQSRSIQIQNELSKVGASNQLGAIGLSETDAQRQASIAEVNATIGAGSQFAGNASQIATSQGQIEAERIRNIGNTASQLVTTGANFASAPTAEFDGQKYRYFNGQWQKG